MFDRCTLNLKASPYIKKTNPFLDRKMFIYYIESLFMFVLLSLY